MLNFEKGNNFCMYMNVFKFFVLGICDYMSYV